MRFVAGKVAVFRWMLPLAIAMALMGGIYLAVRWSAQQSDAVAVKRQQQLVELVISKMQGSIAHDQESVTVWDDAVRKVSQEWDRRWVDSNLGSWMNSYFRHDGAFVIRPDRKPLYAFLAGQTDEQEAFSEIEPEAMPLIAKLQERLAAGGDEGGTSEQVLSIGESDLVRIGGRPAIVSVKPIVSDTGDIVQEPGKEFLHLALRFLDGDLLTHLGEDYGFEDLRFSVLPELGRQRSYVPIVSSSGETIGYFSWLPFRPGADVMKATAPVLLVAGALLFTLTSALSIVLRRRSRRLQESQAELNHLASHDPLTGLANRASFNRLLARVVARSTADQTNALLYLDLDRFKQVNDTLGHPVGDRLMVEVAKRLKATAAGAAISRIGGDEFTIVVERTRQDQVEKLCDSLIAAIRRPFEIDGQPILIGLSIGVAVATGNGADPVEITRKADLALYHAKSAGRNRYAVFGPHMDELIRTKRDLEHDLRAALDAGNQLEVFYQPVYSAQSHEISSLEALIRWRHPSKGSIAPDAFVPLAETAGLIDRLGAFVLKEACSTAREFPGLDIAVNVSAVELGQRHYAAQVLSLLRQFGIEPSRLELEITETALLDEAGVCEKNITALREFGVKFALDDFGTGFSSFGRLQRLEVDRIKIDRSFVHAFDRPGGGVAVVRSIVGVAHAKGLRITAEGVETEEQSEILRELGCDELQGFHLSRPMSKNSLRQLLGTDKAQGTSF